jgi:hypothetical protein
MIDGVVGISGGRGRSRDRSQCDICGQKHSRLECFEFVSALRLSFLVVVQK